MANSIEPIPNHVIIGLGGTGGRIIRAFRRTIYEEFREKEPVVFQRDKNGRVTGKSPHKIRLSYLYLDSNPELMGEDDPTWRVPGDTLQLGNSSKILISDANLRGVLENTASYPAIRPWIGDKGVWSEILGGQVSDAQGGQKRRLGRFLLAASSGSHDGSFNSRLQSLVRNLTANGDARCVFHICAGLAGGTGSGTIIDIVAQTRKLFHSPGGHVILLYLLLPETHPDPLWKRANYHANGYAALLELNAMSVGAYKPYDIMGTGERIDFAELGSAPVPPFDGCYVFTNVNEKQRIVGVTDYQIHNIAASFLFQKIVVVDDNEWAVGTLKKFEECENGDPKTGDNSPERESDAPGARPLRSRRFLTFGIKRLFIPEEEIREYICYSLARQMALQTLHNCWTERQGYSAGAGKENAVESVRSSATLKNWKLSDDHLTLSLPILEHEKTWRTFEREWEIVEKIKETAMEKIRDHRLWLAEVALKCEEFFTEGFRGCGVERFFERKKEDARDQAKEILHLIESDLFEQWKSGGKGLSDLLNILDETLKYLAEFREKCAAKSSEFSKRAGLQEQPSRLQNCINHNNEQWGKIAPLSELFGKRKVLLDAQVRHLRQLYLAKTQARAWAHSQMLASAVIEEVAKLRACVGSLISRFVQVVDGDTTRQTSNPFEGLDGRLASRCVTGAVQEDYKADSIKVYDPAAVRELTHTLVTDKAKQSAFTEEFRRSLSSKLTPRQGFFSFEREFSLPKLFEFLEKTADSMVEDAHNQLVASDKSIAPVLGQSIVKGLGQKYPDRNDLRRFISGVLDDSGLFLEFDQSQENLDAPGCCKGSRLKNLSIIIPEPLTPDAQETYNDLVSVFKANRAEVQIVKGSRPNVLTILTLANLFPLRYAKHTGFLKQAFQTRVSEGSPEKQARARLELFTEGNGSEFPDLFPLSGRQLKERAQAWLIIAQCAGLITKLPHPHTGEDQGWFYYDERKLADAPVGLGFNESELAENIGHELLSKMESAVRERLSDKEIGVKFKADIEACLEKRKTIVAQEFPNPTDPARISLLETLNQALMIFKSLQK